MRRTVLLLLAAAAPLAGCAAVPATPPSPPNPGVGIEAPAAPAETLYHRPIETDERAVDHDTVAYLWPVLGPPRPRAGGGVTWEPRAEFRPRRESMSFDRTRDSLTSWLVLARVPRLRPYALRRAAMLAQARGDSARADSAWRALAATRSLWQWEALRSRADLAQGRGDLAGADALLQSADRTDWSELERAAWLVRRAKLRRALRDDTQAIDLARQTVRRYPSLAPASQALVVLETVLAARGEPLGVEDHLAAADVEVFRGDAAIAARRLEVAFSRLEAAEVWRLGLRLAEIHRGLRRYADGLRATRVAARLAPGDAERARLALECARLHRDAGRADSAFAWFEVAAVEPSLSETAWWEAGQESEAEGDLERGRRYYQDAAALGERRRDEAALRVGLLDFATGARDSALAAWRTVDTDAARFWSAVALRPVDRAASDSLFGALAAMPGYAFYRVAARETLGVRGWPGTVLSGGCGEDGSVGASNDSLCEGFRLARELLALDATADAMTVLARWATGDPRVARDPRALVSAARLAFAAGRLAPGIRYAILATEAAAQAPVDSASRDVGSALRWGIAPWTSPPALDALFAAIPETAAPDSVDRALMQALVWQESKFNPDARSRSNALGLTQLKLATAGDVADWLGEPSPTEARLRDPARNLRYGRAYLERLFQRFGRVRSVALAAYNGGPGRIPPRWREWVDLGGEALVAEFAPYPESRDYVKRIVALRQAYRELRPTAGVAR